MSNVCSRILVVGCGGLGCELAKLLAMNRDNRVTFIDNDTIDTTNLNRQFFFTEGDVGRSKSQVVCEKTKLGEHICGRIEQFKRIEFYSQFDIVYNCLDNDKARSFVNQRCHAAGTRMVDGGSAGWLGQAFCNGKECFDCQPKRVEKVYPVCTIRQVPESFEHCLVWAKMVVESGREDLLDEELGASDVITDTVVPISEDVVECSTAKRIKTSTPAKHLEASIPAKHLKTSTQAEIDQLHTKLRSEPTDSLIYELALIKAQRFSIQPMSLMDSQTFIKKIIPSVCTTNAIVASLMVLSAAQMKNFYLVQGTMSVLRTDLNEKNKQCLVCSVPLYFVRCSGTATVTDFLTKFKAQSLISEGAFFDVGSDQALSDLDGEFLIAIKGEMKNRVYFEVISDGEVDIEISRVK